MIRKLRKRPRPDNLKNESRSAGPSISRRIYMALLLVFGIAVLNYLWGDVFIMRSDGLIVRDSKVVAASYVSRIDAVDINEGQAIKEGDVLLRVDSAEVLERMADLSLRQAELTRQITELQIRFNTSQQLLPLASERESNARQLLTSVEELAGDGLASTSEYETALRVRYDASQNRVRLSAEDGALRAQLSSLEDARTRARTAIRNLEQYYSEGVVTAPSHGVVGASIPSEGDVFVPGEPMLTIYSGDSYVLAYLPRRYLLSIQPGMKVSVSSGRERASGKITKILPVSDTLPMEFQNLFKPRERNQLAIIELDGTVPFPLFEKVKIRTPLWRNIVG